MLPVEQFEASFSTVIKSRQVVRPENITVIINGAQSSFGGIKREFEVGIEILASRRGAQKAKIIFRD